MVMRFYYSENNLVWHEIKRENCVMSIFQVEKLFDVRSWKIICIYSTPLQKQDVMQGQILIGV